MADDPNKLGNLGDLMQQAQEHAQKLQSGIEKAQEELSNTQATADAGAGAVQVTMNGRYVTTKVVVSPKICTGTPEEISTLIATLVLAANNATTEKVQKISQKMLTGLAGTMELPKGLQEIFKGEGQGDQDK